MATARLAGQKTDTPSTRRNGPPGGPAFKGGLSRWPKLERELRLLLHNSSTTVLTTMFDYYAFPADARPAAS